MAADQPLNADIQIHRRVRSQREPQRHDTIKNITHKLRRLILIPPHEEIRTHFVARDADTTDFSAYMGEAYSTSGRGHPIKVGVKSVRDFSVVQQITGINVLNIGHDNFIEETPETVGRDLHQLARDTTGGTDDRL